MTMPKTTVDVVSIDDGLEWLALRSALEFWGIQSGMNKPGYSGCLSGDKAKACTESPFPNEVCRGQSTTYLLTHPHASRHIRILRVISKATLDFPRPSNR